MSGMKDRIVQRNALRIAPKRSAGDGEDSTTRHDDDPGVATVRAALADGAAGSLKRSVNTCLIIWAASRYQKPRRRIRTWARWMALLVLVAHAYMHQLSGLASLLH